jgi:uncharacterized metal-binding protein
MPRSTLLPGIPVLCPSVIIVVLTRPLANVLSILISATGVDEEVEEAWKKFCVLVEYDEYCGAVLEARKFNTTGTPLQVTVGLVFRQLVKLLSLLKQGGKAP